ncbi:MarR family winged helix-turn-helix transcriptional regulator [Rothia dentocariosa]
MKGSSYRAAKPSLREEENLAASRRIQYLLMRIIDNAREQFKTIGKAHGLTPPQARTLLILNRPMLGKEVAAEFDSDPSYITGISTQLENKGLIVRAPGQDRRAKYLSPTPEGARLRTRMMKELDISGPGVHRLSPQEREQLEVLLRKILTADAEPSH